MCINKQTLLVVLLGAVLLATVIFVATTDALAAPSADTPTKTWTIPEQESKRENPQEESKESIDYGKLIFSSQCAMCHGKTGDGSGDLVERLKLVMPDLTDGAVMNSWTDGDLFYILTEGHERMPSQKERLNDKVKWDIINFVRTLPADG